MISLLQPIQISEIHLPNRVITAPLTRLRGTPEHIPTPLTVEYYTQRESSQSLKSKVSRSMCNSMNEHSDNRRSEAFRGEQ